MDPHGVPFLPPGFNPFTVQQQQRYNPVHLQQQQHYTPHVVTGHPPPEMYNHHPSLMPRPGEIGSSPSSSNQSFSQSSHEYNPITPPQLTHSRRGSRESGQSSSSGSFPSTGGSGVPGSLVHRHRRGHATAAMQPPSPIAGRKVRNKGPKKPEVEEPEEEDDAMMSDDDPSSRQRGRKDDAKKSRQDAEQKRRDQLKTAYDQLRGVIPGTSEKTSKVLLVNHARLHIGKLSDDRTGLKRDLEDTQLELKSLRALNERLMNKLTAHKIDFEDDLRATQMEIPPDDEPEHPPHTTSSMAPHPSEQLPAMQRIHPAGQPHHHHRPGHTRALSSLSGSHYQLQSALNGMPMSAPMHPTSLPEYPTVSNSTPASPLKVNTAMVPPHGMAMQPMSAPHMHMTYSGSMGPGPSPASSNSSAAARQALYSPDGQLAYYSDEPSSSGPRSAVSSQMGVNVGQMSLEEQAYLQQHGHPGSKPHSPRGPMVAFNGPTYADSAAYHPPEHFMSAQAYSDPSGGLHPSSAMSNGFAQGMHDPSGYHVGGDVPNMPGAFPQPRDEPLPNPYGRHPFDKTNGHQFLVPGDMVYGNGTDPSMGMEYNAYATGPDGNVTAVDAYLKKSPLQQDGVATPPSTAAPSNQQTPQPMKAGSHNLSIASASSPHHLDGGIHIHSPMPPSSPSGPLVGIAPGMLVNGGDESRDEGTPHAIDVKPEGSWFQSDPTFVG